MEGHIHFWGFLKFEFNQATRWAHEADTQKYLKIQYINTYRNIARTFFPQQILATMTEQIASLTTYNTKKNGIYV